ncbi:GDCCVxC domain-containing (seleno)protein [Flavobacterium sp. FlaQc-28]|uniref:GDCCVxC domain-containing (seleno)protein n=1 Tax=Flavobacterium sp. FlaQc-28 TaxID=3374178 RepID=UPI00375803F9
MNSIIVTKAILQCPECDSKYTERIPLKGKILSSRCVFCSAVFEITQPEQCCIYCAYGNVPCPEKQNEIKKQ